MNANIPQTLPGHWKGRALPNPYPEPSIILIPKLDKDGNNNNNKKRNYQPVSLVNTNPQQDNYERNATNHEKYYTLSPSRLHSRDARIVQHT